MSENEKVDDVDSIVRRSAYGSLTPRVVPPRRSHLS